MSSSPLDTSRSALYSSHSPNVSSTSYCFAARAHLCITTGIPLPSLWQVQVPYTKWQFQHFRVVHWAMQITFSFLFLLVTRLKSLIIPPPSSWFLPLAFPSFLSVSLLLSCTPQTSLWTGYLLGSLLHPSIRSRLPYPTLCQLAFVNFSHTAYQVWLATSFFCMFFTLYCHFNFCHVSICFKRIYSPFCS